MQKIKKEQTPLLLVTTRKRVGQLGRKRPIIKAEDDNVKDETQVSPKRKRVGTVGRR